MPLTSPGGRELFTFTENDLPPGALSKRLLAAKVSVVLTHAPPDAPSPDHRHVHAVDWERPDPIDGVRRDIAAVKDAMAVIGPVEHSVTPDTDPEEVSDESTNFDKVVAVVNGDDKRNDTNTSASSTAPAVDIGAGGLHTPSRGTWTTSSEEDDGRFYFSSDDESTTGTPCRQNGSLRVAGGLEPIHVLSSTSPWRSSGGNFASGNGFATPMSSKCPSPLRSCPRSAISSRREKLYERTESREDWTQHQAAEAAPLPPPPGASSGVPRWASSKTFAAASARMHDLPTSADTPKQQQESRPRQSKPFGDLEQNSVALPASRGESIAAGAHGAGDVTGVTGGMKSREVAETGSTTANGTTVRLDNLALLEHAQGNGWAGSSERGSSSSFPRHDGKRGREGKVTEVDVASSKYSTTSSVFRRPSPAVKLLLDKVSARSFDDPQSSRHTSVFGSETDQSERGAGDGGGEGVLGAFADGDGESAALVVNVLPGWADGGVGSSPVSPVAVGEGGDDGSAFGDATLVESEGVDCIQPLKEREWPPVRGVVAGVDDVQGALESPSDGEEQPHQGRHARRHGSTGMSWGEDAKLALARKRLQWEK